MIVDVFCKQEQKIIGRFDFDPETDGDVLVTPVNSLRHYKPAAISYRFAKRPKEGTIFSCPRCHGPLAVGDTKTDGLLWGQFTLSAKKDAD